MMTQQLSFSILSAPLAAIDRRSLSQAWYSALHLAHDRSAAPSSSSAAETTKSATHFCNPRERTSEQSAAAHEARRAAPDRRDRVRSDATPERRAARSPLARRIERTFLNPARRIERATFVIEGSQARVHVALQHAPGGLRLIAVCPPSVRGGVIRALEEARFALAARGIALHVDVTGDER